MHELDQTLATPAENLACDEVLLDACNQGGPEVLRFWEPADRFVVLGYSNRFLTEADSAACQRWGVPVLRRISGGGAVVQMPGCLNYALVLRLDGGTGRQTIGVTNQLVLGHIAKALQPLIGGEVRIDGDTDLALGSRKFAGSAQRRLGHALLFHGSFLLEADIDWMERLLPLPSRQPAYRAGRRHHDFVTNLGLPPDVVKGALRSAWGAVTPLVEWPRSQVEPLVRTKYTDGSWIRKF
ncbi:MAG TPA: lipoate--protein ligase family protein [Verrucomicrobiota bacterium]|nr:lipoate--protein ligase family protein [Verrucomicrobiota bacterium]HRZ38838.1 lipoate--protein ligase family protein [Candidatus Paceibacterota bacterium]